MRMRSVPAGRLIWILAGIAALACGGDQGPPPTVRLSIQGRVLSADATPLPVAGATVALRYFQGLLSNPQTRVQTTTTEVGNYELSYTFTSICGPQDNTTYWIEASADGYETASTFVTPDFSDPVIRCTSEPQVIDLTLRPFGSLQVITSTSGSEPDPDGYALQIGEVIPGSVFEYPMEVNDELILSDLLPRQYPIELTDVAGHCTVAGDNPRTVTVTVRNTTVSTFQVTCTPSSSCGPPD